MNEMLNPLLIYLAEHHVIYQYRLVNAKDHYMGLIQTESVSGRQNLDLDLLGSLISVYSSLTTNLTRHLQLRSISMANSTILRCMTIQPRRHGGCQSRILITFSSSVRPSLIEFHLIVHRMLIPLLQALDCTASSECVDSPQVA